MATKHLDSHHIIRRCPGCQIGIVELLSYQKMKDGAWWPLKILRVTCNCWHPNSSCCLVGNCGAGSGDPVFNRQWLTCFSNLVLGIDGEEI